MVNYEKNVFINCPFDDEYELLFNAILFTVYRCGFILRCAKEFQDTSSIRINNILQLIDESKYSIHDLSRVNFEGENKLPRFNMPLELGVLIGCRRWGAKKHKQKEYLIIESEQFRFKQFISDISGQDIKSHDNNVEKVVKCIRDWLSRKSLDTVPSPSIIYEEYKSFQNKLPELCNAVKWKVGESTFGEYSGLVISWLTLNAN